MNTAAKNKARQEFLRTHIGFIRAGRDKALHEVALIMKEEGLYSPKADTRRVKQGILGILAGFDGMRTGNNGYNWHYWQSINGWDVWKPHSLI